MPSATSGGPPSATEPDSVAVPTTATGPVPAGGPPSEWHNGLYKRVVNALYALPGLFKTNLNISGVRVTDLYTLNSALGASIEESVVDNLNTLRSIWDPDGAFQLYAFVRQPQVFPDVRLQTEAPGVDEPILMGIELKGSSAASWALPKRFGSGTHFPALSLCATSAAAASRKSPSNGSP